jgi:hypothetical protein
MLSLLVVGWRDNDPSNPLNWSLLKKWVAMFMCALIAIAMTVPSSIEGATQDAFDACFGVNSMTGSMTTGMLIHLFFIYNFPLFCFGFEAQVQYVLTDVMSTGIFLIGIGVGSLFSGPFSETSAATLFISLLWSWPLYSLWERLWPQTTALLSHSASFALCLQPRL